MRRLLLRVSAVLVVASFATLATTRSDAECTDPNTCPADAYRALRDKGRNEPDASAKEAIVMQLKEIEQHIALVAVRAECEGALPFKVLVDKKEVSADGPIPLAPGVHKILVKCPHGEAEKTVSVNKRDRVELEVPMDTAQASKTPAPPSRGCGCAVVGAP